MSDSVVRTLAGILMVLALAQAACGPSGTQNPGAGDVADLSDATTADLAAPPDAALPGDDTSAPGDASAPDDVPAPSDGLAQDAPSPADAVTADATDPCAGAACQDHARCVVGASGATSCACDPGYRPNGEACERDPAAWSTGVTGDAAVSPATLVLPDAVAAAYSVLTNEIELPVAQAGGLASVEPGAVLVGSRGLGFLRKVISTKVEGDQLVVRTGAATFEDLFQTADFGLKIPLGSGTTRGAWIDEDLAGKVLADEPILDIGRLRVSVVSGYLAFDPGFSVEYRRGFGGLEWLRFGTDGYLDMELQIEATFSWAIDVDLANLELTLGTTSVPVLVAGVPVVFTPELKLQIGLRLDSKGCAKVVQSFRMTGDLSSTVEYTAGADPALTYTDESQFDFDAITPTVQGPYEGNGTARAYANLLASVQVYDVAGPYVKAGPYAKLAFDNAEAECSWQFDVGAEGAIGVDAEVFGMNAFSGEKTVFSVEKTLADGPCACDYGALYACTGPVNEANKSCWDKCQTYTHACDWKACQADCDAVQHEGLRDCLEAAGCWNSPGTGAKNFLECLAVCQLDVASCYGLHVGEDLDACQACDKGCIGVCNQTEGTQACDLAEPGE